MTDGHFAGVLSALSGTMADVTVPQQLAARGARLLARCDPAALVRRGLHRTVSSQVRGWRRPRWWTEVAFILGSYALYSLTRNVVPAHEELARRHAIGLLHLEQRLHLDPERMVNSWLGGIRWLAEIANSYYAALHFLITIGVLVWLYRRHPVHYRGVRTALYATNLIALLGFWLYPLAPPRMLPGFVDTIVRFPIWISWDSTDVAKASNQFAAMPSLHVAWSLWCGIVLFRLARRRWVRLAAPLYPLFTVAVILGTANHFVLDAIGGVLTLSVGFVVSWAIFGRPAFATPERACRGELPSPRPAEVSTASPASR